MEKKRKGRNKPIALKKDEKSKFILFAMKSLKNINKYPNIVTLFKTGRYHFTILPDGMHKSRVNGKIVK